MGESSRPFGRRPQPTDVREDDPAPGADITDLDLDLATRSLRRLVLAAEHYRHTVSDAIGLGTTESQAVSVLSLHEGRGQSQLARDLQLTSSAATALVDRLERQGVAERTRHPHDRRRTVVRLTERGHQIAADSQACLARALLVLEPAQIASFAAGLAGVAEALDEVATEIGAGRIAPMTTQALPASTP